MASGTSKSRKLLHRRTIVLEGYEREDGWYDIEGHLVDIKGYDFPVMNGIRKTGDPIHDMILGITVDPDMTIQDAYAKTIARPYAGFCETITDHYQSLKGLKIAPGFTKAVKERFAGVKGCTHLTELIGTLATVAFQTRYGSAEAHHPNRPPQLGGCHALDTTGPVVAKFYPQWKEEKNPK